MTSGANFMPMVPSTPSVDLLVMERCTAVIIRPCGRQARWTLWARAPDGVIEAVQDSQRDFYLGVQWHPERSGPGPLGLGVFRSLVAAAAGRMDFREHVSHAAS